MEYFIRNLSDPDVLVPGKNLSALQDLWASSDPYEYDDELFVKAVKQCLSWHIEKNDFYKDWMQKNNFSVDSLNDISDIAKIPFLHANFYKTHVIKTVKDEDIAITLTSSGTTGQKSQMFFDNWTIFASDKSADMESYKLGMITDEPTNFLLYSYEPAEGVNVGTLRTRQMMRRYAKENELVYALKYTGKGHEFDLFGCIDALLRFEKEGLPVRLLGFPAFLYFTLEKMEDMGYPPLKLNPKSLVMMGGGWKGFVDKQLSPQEFRAYIKERLGLPESCCHESYGAVEHGVAYMDCNNHHFHIPAYSRVLIRDVRTLEVLPYGKPGFLNVISPINTGVPVVSLLLGDLAVLHEGKSCGCGINALWFEILGRAGTTKNRSCAIAAAELLRK
ncbi:hypothetical protein A3206_06920 [Candidatus Methanomassiliicoccus intestinalis]|uniref:Putative acyl-protein synthetase n=1 Tax=Methanomassiliicoccus intestinalis (strain Issoire-Mx1) TaxID=1295009 RepID=R9T991_METII|nr:acyl-protein synthetase [Candidatus Methanomassiliicoccus intestinalis]AGN25953.1 putative acyl-protein synthetase [Candidatus Methanomassiliicoccus intestinalis Issoire-Mx1]TQS83364.1 MAG: hypothetical protein A3206_06920 [Candidatus Methanomassiliicoccus intestinalis]